MPSLAADALFLATALTYGVACALFVVFLIGGDKTERAGRLAPRLVGLGALLHAGHIVVASLVWRVCPVEGIHFAMSVVSMLACAVYMAMRSRFRIDVVGAFVAPLALTFLLASRFVGSGELEPSARVKSAILPFHIAANLIGVSLFTLACAAAIAYLLQEKRLKKKKVGWLFVHHMPPLDVLDRAEHRFLLAGFPLLTVGIVTGTLWARTVEAGSAADIARAAFGYASWVLFALVLLLRAVVGWRGRRAAYGTIAGFSAAVIVLVMYLLRSAGSAA